MTHGHFIISAFYHFLYLQPSDLALVQILLLVIDKMWASMDACSTVTMIIDTCISEQLLALNMQKDILNLRCQIHGVYYFDIRYLPGTLNSVCLLG